MKTFKQFTEQWTPKGTFGKSYGKYEGLYDRVKSKEDVEFEKSEFKRETGIPLAKKGSGKINSDVLKAHPELNPDKPSDYIKLKRLSAKVKKA